MGLVKRETHAVESEGYRPLDEAASLKVKKAAKRGSSATVPSRRLLRDQRGSSKQIVLSPITGEEVELAELFPATEESSE